ncbi:MULTISPECIES: sugar ABC transporter substrate-binding protein [Streptomyces]|uniref:sugar ABC transporter substrate-binding protein n=1 Tax=Streptomyces TaxID=1883 RepID=UPI0013693DE4|nr:sugar ABC transporter substrate-binding protein [Streptomyces sp. SID2888]MYV45432.1 extracellular solute-binding protein [Streptomyces sp. SID2888]
MRTPRGRARSAVTLSAVAGLAATTLTGCGSSDSAAESNAPLNVWVRGAGDSEKAYQAVFDAYTKKTGVKVKLFMTLTDFETKLNAAAAAHQLPDVVVNDAAQLGAFRSQGIIREVDRKSVAGQDQVTDLAWKSTRGGDGKYYAVPFSAQANVLFERSDWAKKLKLKTPTTWDELAATAKAFTAQDPDGNGKADTYGLAVPGTTTRGYISWYWSTFLWQAGGDYVKDAGNGKYTPTVNSPQALRAATWFEDLFCKDKSVQPGSLNNDTADTNKVFQTGVAGLYLTGPYAFATMDGSDVKGKYEVVAPPSGPQGSDVLAEGTSVYLMAGSKEPEHSQQLADFMITPEAQKIGMTAVPTASIVRLSVNKNVDTAAVRDNDPRWALTQKLYQENGHYEPVYLPNWGELRQATSEALNKMVAGCSSPKATLDQLNDTFRTLLEQQGVAAD